MNIISLHGEYTGQELCGYCHASYSTSYGITASSMTPVTYDRLINVGWRRSGCFLYKPIMHKTCCPQYTIRLEASAFKANKSQRQVQRRFDRFLQTGSVLLDDSDVAAMHDLQPVELLIETVSPECTEERFALYKKYQVSVHGDDATELTEAGFTRFLCSSPLTPTPSSSSLPYGSYHQLYRLSGRLVAISVIDLLPSGVSSVYLIYDPDDRHLVLGKYTALRDIELCRSLGLRYYYMGFYIHSCEKMRYKGEYSPSELLCPTSLQWFPLETCIPAIDKFRFTPFAPALQQERAALVDQEEDKGLEVFAPRFPMRTPVEEIQLDLGIEQLVAIEDLNARGKQLLRPMLQGFVDVTGTIAADMVIKLC